MGVVMMTGETKATTSETTRTIHGVGEKQTAAGQERMIVVNMGSVNVNANANEIVNDTTPTETGIGIGIGTGVTGHLQALHRDVLRHHDPVHPVRTLNDLALPLGPGPGPSRLSTRQSRTLRRRVCLQQRPIL
jgi:hypothetical protein